MFVKIITENVMNIKNDITREIYKIRVFESTVDQNTH